MGEEQFYSVWTGGRETRTVGWQEKKVERDGTAPKGSGEEEDKIVGLYIHNSSSQEGATYQRDKSRGGRLLSCRKGG